MKTNLPEPLTKVIRSMEKVLDRNPFCQRGWLAKRGFAYLDQGEYSDKGKPELVVLVSDPFDQTHHRYHWFGHVFRSRYYTAGCPWCAVLILAKTREIDGEDDGSVVVNFLNHVAGARGRETIFALQQGVDDLVSWHPDFDSAVSILIARIARFNPSRHEYQLITQEESWTGEYFHVQDIEAPPFDDCTQQDYTDVYIRSYVPKHSNVRRS